MSEQPSDAYRELIEAVKKIMAESMNVDGTFPRVIGFRMVVSGMPFENQEMPFNFLEMSCNTPEMPSEEEDHLVEIHEINDDLMIVCDVSEYDPDLIRIFFEGEQLHIVSHERESPIAIVDLPRADPGTASMTCINGILEITCRKDAGREDPNRNHRIIHTE
ncbi:MAG: hypothetical protein D5R96_09520 [Methanocalculus sp. MSAO_Arc2]|uniref:Hsp20/alpha crystallin family protein n=1 Tax=Methanocalculus sp. MSAO_Arc2 TaxID=2293855 RepID=UPI000FEF37F1|nr:MAG: hypothetical protein D5R96_09520 [Methanocalculus sp. MSAO_Arc2]